MPTEEQMQWVLHHMSEMLVCPQDRTRLRFGDLECPHCGADIEDVLRRWAERLLADLTEDTSRRGD